jgi:putative addiction module killer protein
MSSLPGRAFQRCVANFVGNDYGPGYRVYYKDTGKEIIILICGGDKRTQQADIAEARRIARTYEEEN